MERRSRGWPSNLFALCGGRDGNVEFFAWDELQVLHDLIPMAVARGELDRDALADILRTLMEPLSEEG